MEATERESLIRKIKKALALASNNPSIQEAESALLKAQETMAKHNISMAEIGHEEEKKKNVKEELVTDDYVKIDWWQKELAQVIADNFRCHVFWYWNNISPKKRIYKTAFLGLEEDVDICLELYKFAESVLAFYSQQYVSLKRIKVKAQQNIALNSYRRGFVVGLREKFEEQVKMNNWGLIIVKDALVVQEYESLDLQTEKAKKIEIGNSDALLAGYEKGKTFNADNPSLPSSDSRYDFFKQFEGKIVRMVAKADPYNNFKVTKVHEKSITGLDEEGRQKAFWFFDINLIEEI